ncbi:hypothetical protein BABINDRAFT_160874 [Babjeviella inositovora NRRL Y-12698]|uniref:GST N-terminal domain-containing protein n=1 Tax=Babjeviella inositovora NRRL Y-12698 TaxID=984486 RepID=A0A1E3QSF1_9ASCO|nr:uncharacterized protein BABINDRAFT_160874 [Babjeviella inositovora NRRL Y-12698]ODQ80619.1 hypothetical protein BABINDRAFT_160874 [Babjeviella inositovora NRRL Y-12698]
MLETPNQVVFWDLDSKLPTKVWSPNTMKVRSVLNFKRIPYTTKFLPFTAFPPLLEKEGIKPWPRAPHYTLPVISHKGKTIMGSDQIVAYLEKEFPHTRSVYPTPGALEESKAMCKLVPRIFFVIGPTTAAFISSIMEDVDQKYFLWKFDERDGIIDIPKFLNNPVAVLEKWDLIQRFYNNFEGFTSKKFSAEQLGRLKSGKYLFGDYCSYADLLYFSLLFWVLIGYSQDKSRTSELVTDEWLKAWYNRMLVYSSNTTPRL